MTIKIGKFLDEFIISGTMDEFAEYILSREEKLLERFVSRVERRNKTSTDTLQPVWKSTTMLMNPNSPDYLGIKSASGFAAWRAKKIEEKALKMEKRGKENWYLIIEK